MKPFQPITCINCNAIILLAPAGVLFMTTHLKCAHCGATRTIKPADSKPAAQLAVAPA